MSSKHPRVHTLPHGFLRGLASFRELEARIAALPEELERGDAFEVLVEAYLRTTPVWQVADLWLVGQVPLDIRRALNLPADAKGIDGVMRTRAGLLVPYQVKFRIGRPKVGVAEVSTFLGLTDRAEDRVLISNADRYAADVEVRDRLRLLRGTDFDALSADDWTAIADWVEARPVIRSKATPRIEDQQQALACIANTLTTHDRATVVMPCGTGKTLVQLWAAEQQQPRTVLVLVPSLALLSQTLDEWSRQTSWGERFEYLCVCSDPTVSAEQDAVQMRTTEVPFHVDTDPVVVRRFLDRPSTGSTRVVLSTYQSAPVVADGMREAEAFDLGIFDEAHKTTGLRDGVFAFALDDARLPIRKRLFFTATPRHIDIRHRDREGDFRVASMDDPEVYGLRAYSQTFADAVERGIICDYRVVVSVVDPQEVTEFALQHGITLVGRDPQATQWVATQIAVSKAIAETGVARVITFHSRVKQAQDFASRTTRGIGQYIKGFIVDHVNGAQRVADRKDVLAGFKDNQRRLVTNARCLTDGVNLPAVDMVAFCSPRKSRVDIVQAVGRAMRKPENGTKTLGYVVVPILLAPHETDAISDACADTDWEDVVDVLEALREHDARLDEIIRVLQVAKGRGDVFNPRALMERVMVLGPLVSLDLLKRHISAVVVERLGVTWDVRYGQLVAFKQHRGHANVPARYPECPALGHWLDIQRRRHKQGRLSLERKTRLEDVGVVWDPHDAAWEEWFQQLTAFRQQNGHCAVSESECGGLARWVQTQRQERRRGTLPTDRAARLDSVGIVWEPYEAAWEASYQQLAAFQAKYGHCSVPIEFPDNPSLPAWVGTQRQARKQGTLSSEQKIRLASIGFLWVPHDEKWEQRFQELVEFQRQHGHCRVTERDSEPCALAFWIRTQRQAKKRGSLSADRVARLDAIGFDWDPAASAWEFHCRRLFDFHASTGHCILPIEENSYGDLRRWVTKQRSARRRGSLSPSRVAQLDALGFVWDPQDAEWDTRYLQLVAFQQQRGHSNVPADPDHRTLAGWLLLQRKAKRRGVLPQERERRLNELGVVWDPLGSWEQQFQDLVAFHREHGHCEVPASSPAHAALLGWLRRQRMEKKQGRMSSDRVARLEALGLVWNPQEAAWSKKYRELAAFRQQHGHCDVPDGYAEDPSLYWWLTHQRQAMKRGDLSADRMARLEALGFPWKRERRKQSSRST